MTGFLASLRILIFFSIPDFFPFLICQNTKRRSLPYLSGSPQGSPSMGTIPVSSLPELSARSCSSHPPSPEISGGKKKVALSAPARQRLPSTAPRKNPGFSSSFETRHRSALFDPRSRDFPIPSPAKPPGTMPKFERPENLPPISEGFRKRP